MKKKTVSKGAPAPSTNDDPRCPQCNGPMVERKSYRGAFLGCQSFPSCRGTRPMPASDSPTVKPGRTGWANLPPDARSDGEEAVEMPLLVGSVEQEAIWKEICEGETHLVVDALAGTGKSTTIVEAVRRLPRTAKIGILAFNVHIAREMTAKLGQANIRNAQASTYNSFGMRALRNARPSIQLKEDKLDLIMGEVLPPETYKIFAGPVSKLVGLLKCHLYEPTFENMDHLMDRFEIDCPSNMVTDAMHFAAKCLEECEKRLTVVDYDDQIWITVKHKLPVPQFDILMVDEAQDTSLMQQELALMACQSGRIVITGDKHQAIYGFRGADVDAIPRMAQALETTARGCKTLPLTVSRRCPKSHIALAQMKVPAIQALPDAPDGIVENMKDEDAIEIMKPGDLVLCRVNAPLISKCYRLIKRGVKAVVRGRNIGSGIKSLLRRLRATNTTDLMTKIGQYNEKESAKLLALGRKGASRLLALQDRVDCLIALCEGVDDVMEIEQKIDRIFSDFDENGRPKDAVVFGTVHRTKGLEAPNVFILSPQLIPHPMAGADWEQAQEDNLAYVAVTRAKGNAEYPGRLVFVGQTPPAFGGPPLKSMSFRDMKRSARQTQTNIQETLERMDD